MSNTKKVFLVNESTMAVPEISWDIIFNTVAKHLNKMTLEPVSVVFKNKKDIKDINNKYRKKDKVTNILSFIDLRDIFICLELVKEEAKERKMGIDKWLAQLFIHGMLHLEGFRHDTNKGAKEMEMLEDEIIKGLE